MGDLNYTNLIISEICNFMQLINLIFKWTPNYEAWKSI